MSKAITVYHGSEHIIEIPVFGKGRAANDYGRGFYMTKDKHLAGEWAVLWTGKDGFINEYLLELNGLNVLELDELPIENWIAILIANRRGDYAEELQERLEQFTGKFGVNTTTYDVIQGYRADDAFFRYVEAFTIGALSLEKLVAAMKLGDLGVQVCLKSKKSFDAVRFVGSSDAAVSTFHQSARNRDTHARKQYRSMKGKGVGTTIYDMLKEDYHGGL